jgi:ATP-dependent DNA ligase
METGGLLSERYLPIVEHVHGIINPRAPGNATHCAFDLLELDGNDVRRLPIEERKRLLATLLRRAHSSMVANEYFRD